VTFRAFAAGAALALAGLATASPARAQDAAQYFKNNCAACHTIGGGRMTGPDLKGATARRDRAWLVRFIADPQQVIAGGDAYALELKRQSYGLVMPTLPTLTPALIDALIDYIEAESGGAAGSEATASPAPAAPHAAFTQGDIDAGRAIFTGRRRLAAGGPSCLSCHTTADLGGLGGGTLAPDLTRVYERLGARQGLTGWLGAPPTPTMQSLFAARALTPDEVRTLVAYFEDAARQPGQAGRQGAVAFAMLGLTLAIAGLFVMDVSWRHRFRSVRRALVERATGKRT